MKKVGYTVVILSLIFIMFSLYDFNFTSINTIDTQEIINHCNRIEEAEEFFNKFLDMADVQQVKIDRDANPYPGVNYYLVSDFNSLQELKSYILELYAYQLPLNIISNILKIQIILKTILLYISKSIISYIVILQDTEVVEGKMYMITAHLI